MAVVGSCKRKVVFLFLIIFLLSFSQNIEARSARRGAAGSFLIANNFGFGNSRLNSAFANPFFRGGISAVVLDPFSFGIANAFDNRFLATQFLDGFTNGKLANISKGGGGKQKAAGEKSQTANFSSVVPINGFSKLFNVNDASGKTQLVAGEVKNGNLVLDRSAITNGVNGGKAVFSENATSPLARQVSDYTEGKASSSASNSQEALAAAQAIYHRRVIQ